MIALDAERSAETTNEIATEPLVLTPLEQPEELWVVVDRHIRSMVAFTRGNKTEAAKLLGIDRRTLYRRLEKGKSECQRSSGPVRSLTRQ